MRTPDGWATGTGGCKGGTLLEWPLAQAIIANPILNSPFDEPERHFYFDEDGITDKIVQSRRISGYFVPIPPPKKKSTQINSRPRKTEGDGH